MLKLGTRLSLAALAIVLAFSLAPGQTLNLDVKETKLDNGLTILTLEAHSAAVVSKAQQVKQLLETLGKVTTVQYTD